MNTKIKSNLLETLGRATRLIDYYEETLDKNTIEDLTDICGIISVLIYRADSADIDNIEDDMFIPCEKLQRRVIELIKN